MGLTYPEVVSTIMLLFLILNFAFGRGDKHGKEIETLKEKVHSLDLTQRDREALIKEHVGDEYATKEDIQRIEKQIERFAESQRQYHEALMTMLHPLSKQITFSAVMQ